VAHEAAFWGHLPDDFNQWNLKDDYGTTVADIAAKNNTLPRNFKLLKFLIKVNLINKIVR